jgi:HD superfamily phosphohydrolase
LLSLFQTRYKLFKQVYMHKKNIGIDLMVKDILILSDKHFHFTEAIYNPEEYLKLDDGILNIIEKFSLTSSDPDLLRASEKVKDLQNRNLYKFVGEILINSTFTANIKLEDILCCENPKDEFYLGPQDIELVSHSIDYGNSDRDPYSHIYFYKNENPYDYFTVSSKKVSLSVPNVFKESYLFLFCKNKDKFERAKSVFFAFLKRINIEENKNQNYQTPIKNNTTRFISNKTNRSESANIHEEISKNLNVKFNKIN